MKKLLLGLLIATQIFSAKSQENLILKSQTTYSENLSNVWGWTAPDGSEYVVLGTFLGTYIIDISDPAAPEELQYIDGSNSTWRQIAEWNGYAYVVNESGDGLLCINLNDLPASADYNFSDGGIGLTTAHQVWADETGIVYVFGSNLYGGSTVMFDANINPLDPEFLGATDTWYVHHGYSRGDTLYESNIYQGSFSIWDISDKAMPLLLATQETPGSFTHNVVPSDNGQYIFTTDEKNNGSLAAYDISDFSDITFLSEFRSEPGTNSIPHYAWFKDDFVITAWYKDGVVITDVSRPEFMVETGSYDTYPTGGSGFSGAWGVYPYFPSGNMVVSDISEGLFVLEPTYTHASFLEGVITDESTGLSLFNVQIDIDSYIEASVASGLSGEYLTGINGDGMVNVTFSAEGYADFTTTVELIAGESFVLNVTMEPVTASCESPGDLIVLDITETSARLDWNNVGADLYNVLYKQVGGGNVITSTSNTFLDIEGLDPCSVYKWRVRAVCPDGSKPKSPPGTFFTSGVSCRYVDDSALDVGYELYPNPVVDYAFIKISSDEIQSLRLFNIQAVEMELDYTRSNNLLMINTSALTTGFYFIHLVNQDQKVKTFSFEKL